MVLFWFLLALVLLVAALVILRLDARQRRDGARVRPGATEKDRARASGEGPDDELAGADDAPEVDDDENPPATGPAGEPADAPSAGAAAGAAAAPAAAPAGVSGAPKLAPFQRASGAGAKSGRDEPTTAVHTSADADAVEAPEADAEVSAEASAGADADAGKLGAEAVSTGDSSGTRQAAEDSAEDAAGDAATQSESADASDSGAVTSGLAAGAAVAAGAGAAAVAGGVAATRSSGADAGTPAADRTEADAAATADDEAIAAASASGAYAGAPGSTGSAENDELPGFDEQQGYSAPAERSEPSPRLLDRVRALLPARRTNGRTEEVAPESVDPLAGSPVVLWLEDREFAPTPTPAPEFRHGDFASGLSALGTVSHGVFRGRRAIMGVTGGRTVLALRRDTASDTVLDLSRTDVDAEPGFHDAGQVGALEARTSDYGRLDLIDRDRLIEALADVPADVRRIWAEGEWVAATIDGVDDPGTWDDVVMALHAAADILAPLPPIGGRARALPAEIDPGAPAAADGPEADPAMGMDGEVGTGTHGLAPMPGAEGDVVVDTPAGTRRPTAPGAPTAPAADIRPAAAPVKDDRVAGSPGRADQGGDDSPSGATTAAFPVAGTTPAGAASPNEPAPQPRRSGHLRLVPDRTARDLTDAPVVADRGESDADVTPTRSGSTGAKSGTPANPELASETASASVPSSASSTSSTTEPAPESAPEQEPQPPSDPFAEIMDHSGSVEARGDVAADHLEPRPPLSRPTRGVGQSYPDDASVPPLAAGAATGGAGIKPLGSEDDEDEIRDEVERFDAARIDGRSDLEDSAAGRHGAPEEQSAGRHGADDLDPSEVTQRLSVAELAARMGVSPEEMRSEGRRRRRRAEPEDESSGEAGTDGDTAPETGDDPGSESDGDGKAVRGRERPGIEPDVEKTTRIVLPPDIKD